MTDTQLQLRVGQDIIQAGSENDPIYWKGNKRGEACVIDFYTEMALEGRGYQIRAGVLTSPIIGDVALTTTAAEFAVEALEGMAIMAVYLNIAIAVGTAVLHEYILGSGDGSISGGTVFVPLPLLVETSSVASGAIAQTGGAGGVTVIADAATTRAHWHGANPVAVGAGHAITTHTFEPRTPPTVANVAHFWVGIASSATAPSYFASLDWIQMPWANIS